MALEKLRIRSIVAAPLLGDSPKGGWSAEIRPDDSVHTLIAVHTDDGITGLWQRLHEWRTGRSGAQGAGAALRRRECAGAGAGHREAAPEHLLDGTRRHSHPHDQRHRHRAVGHPRQGAGTAGGPAAGRHLPRAGSALCSLLMEEPALMKTVLAAYRAQGFRAFKIGWGPFGRRDEREARRGDRAGRARGGRRRTASSSSMPAPAMPTGRMATSGRLNTADDARRLRCRLVRGGAEARCHRRLLRTAPAEPGADRRRRGADPPAELPAVGWTRGAFDIVQPDVTKVGGISEQRRIAWMADEFGVKYIGHGWNTAIGVAADLQTCCRLATRGSRRVHRRQRLCRRHPGGAIQAGFGGLSRDSDETRPWR